MENVNVILCKNTANNNISRSSINIFDKLSNVIQGSDSSGSSLSKPAIKSTESIQNETGNLSNEYQLNGLSANTLVAPSSDIYQVTGETKLKQEETINISDDDASLIIESIDRLDPNINTCDHQTHFDSYNQFNLDLATKLVKRANSTTKDYVTYKCNNLRYPAVLAMNMSKFGATPIITNHKTKAKSKNEKLMKPTAPFIEVDASHFSLSCTQEKLDVIVPTNRKRKRKEISITIHEDNLSPVKEKRRNFGIEVTKSDVDVSFHKTVPLRLWESQLRNVITEREKNGAVMNERVLAGCMRCSTKLHHNLNNAQCFNYIALNSNMYLMLGDMLRLIIRCPKLKKTLLSQIQNLHIVPGTEVSLINPRDDQKVCEINLKEKNLTLVGCEIKSIVEIDLSSLCDLFISSGKIWETSISPDKLTALSLEAIDLMTSRLFNHLNSNSIGYFVPFNIATLFEEYIKGVGVACQLFCLVFVKLFIAESASLSDFDSVKNYIMMGKNDSTTIFSRFETCHSSIGPILKALKDFRLPILNRAAYLSNHLNSNNPEQNFFFDSPEMAVKSIISLIREKLYESLGPIIRNLEDLKTYLNLISENESYFGAFVDTFEKMQYTQANCPAGSPFKQMQEDLNNISIVIKRGSFSEQVIVEYNTCKSLAGFFEPDNFQKCLVIVTQQLSDILRDLTISKNMLEHQWLPLSLYDCKVSAPAIGKNTESMINTLHAQIDEVELWLRSVHSNVFLFYALRMMKGLVLYNSDLREDCFLQPHSLNLPYGSNNEVSEPKNVHYDSKTIPTIMNNRALTDQIVISID